MHASPAYVVRAGPIDAPEDLERCAVIAPGGDSGAFAAHLAPFGVLALACHGYMAMWAMVKQGLGIGVLAERLGDADPAVVRVAGDSAPVEFPVCLVAHRDVLTNRRLRCAFDFLARELA